MDTNTTPAYPKTDSYPKTAPVVPAPNLSSKKKRTGGFLRFLKAVFVHNIGYKLLALFSSVVLWVLAVGLL